MAVMLWGKIQVSSDLLLGVGCVSLFTLSLLILCLHFKTKTGRAKRKGATSEEDSSHETMLVGLNSNHTKRGVRINTEDGFHDDRGHYDLIGPDAPIVQSASMKTFQPTKGPTGGLAAIRVKDAGYETLPVDEPYDITYSTINEKSSKTKSGLQVDENALYSLIEDVVPSNKSKNVKSAHTRNRSQTLIKDENPDSFPIYSVVNKSPPPVGGVSSTFSIDESVNIHRKKKKKSKKKVDSGDSHEDKSAQGAKGTVIPIYSLVVRTKPQRDQNMPELTLEPENKEQENLVNGEVGNKNTDDNCINSINTKDNSKKRKTKVHKTSNEISINKKDLTSNRGRETIDDDGGYEQLPDPVEGEVFGGNLCHSESEQTSSQKSQRLALTLPASTEEQSRNTKGGRRRSRSEQEVSRNNSLTSTSVKRCNSWAKCDLMQLPYQLPSEIPVLYTTAV